VKGAHGLSRREQAILRELYIWRDREARRRDRPLFKVLGDRRLVRLARARPRTRKDLTAASGLKPYHVRRYGKRILRAVKRGLSVRPPDPPPPPPRHSEAEIARFQALRTWRKGVAERRGVGPGVVVSNAVLWTLAERNPCTCEGLKRIDGLGPWKRKTYGEAILDVLEAERQVLDTE